MNLGCKKGANLAIKFAKVLKNTNKKNYILLPSVQSIYYIKQKIKNKSLNLGAQDCSPFKIGAFTGDVSASMIKELGCKYILIGHSERRLLYSEDGKILKAKLKSAIHNKLKIIFCVGEKLIDYKKSNTRKIINNQISEVFDKNIDFKNIAIAYEPVWAIGTNKTPSLKEIEIVHGYIKSIFKKKYRIENICVIYGGSVNLNNSKAIFRVKNVDGGLIGGASLKANEFKKIYDSLN